MWTYMQECLSVESEFSELLFLCGFSLRIKIIKLFCVDKIWQVQASTK